MTDKLRKHGVKSLFEATLEVIPLYQKRLIEGKVNIIYFGKVAAKAKPDTQDKVDALQKLENAKNSVADDELLMESFAELLEELSPVKKTVVKAKGKKE